MGATSYEAESSHVPQLAKNRNKHSQCAFIPDCRRSSTPRVVNHSAGAMSPSGTPRCFGGPIKLFAWPRLSAASLRTAQTSPRNTFSCTKGRRLSARNSRNVHAAFDADRGEKVAEIVMRDALHPDLFRRVRHAVLTFENAHHCCVPRFLRPFRSQFGQHPLKVWNHRHKACLAVLCPSFWVAANV